jgi:hypothetical protein
MPVSFQMNGFQLAKYMNTFGNSLSAVLLYLLFFSALTGCIIGVLLLMHKNVRLAYDWLCLLTCIGSGLFVFITSSSNMGSKLQSGAYFILFGWIIALVAQIKFNNDNGHILTISKTKGKILKKIFENQTLFNILSIIILLFALFKIVKIHLIDIGLIKGAFLVSITPRMSESHKSKNYCA